MAEGSTGNASGLNTDAISRLGKRVLDMTAELESLNELRPEDVEHVIAQIKAVDVEVKRALGETRVGNLEAHLLRNNVQILKLTQENMVLKAHIRVSDERRSKIQRLQEAILLDMLKVNTATNFFNTVVYDQADNRVAACSKLKALSNQHSADAIVGYSALMLFDKYMAHNGVQDDLDTVVQGCFAISYEDWRSKGHAEFEEIKFAKPIESITSTLGKWNPLDPTSLTFLDDYLQVLLPSQSQIVQGSQIQMLVLQFHSAMESVGYLPSVIAAAAIIKVASKADSGDGVALFAAARRLFFQEILGDQSVLGAYRVSVGNCMKDMENSYLKLERWKTNQFETGPSKFRLFKSGLFKSGPSKAGPSKVCPSSSSSQPRSELHLGFELNWSTTPDVKETGPHETDDSEVKIEDKGVKGWVKRVGKRVQDVKEKFKK